MLPSDAYIPTTAYKRHQSEHAASATCLLLARLADELNTVGEV